MTRCLKCGFSYFALFEFIENSCSWDTRQKAPTSSIQAHDQEILAVAFNPGAETLLITGSADKVRVRVRGATTTTNEWFQIDDPVARYQKVGDGETPAHV
jgi:WD40 repeat protein